MKADVADSGLLSRHRSVLVVIDAQTRLAPAIDGSAAALARIGLLLKAAGRLGVPVIVTEQYPAGLGRTVASLQTVLDDLPAPASVLTKTHFSAWAEPTFRAAIAGTGRRQLVFTGFEAHVCVLQTAFAAHAAGFPSFLVADAIGSRDPRSLAMTLERARIRGLAPIVAEMAVFEWLGQAATPEFRDLLGALK